MTYSKLYFGKELGELTFEDIEKFFVNERDESDKIEFKSYHNPDEKNHTGKENGVIRAICGLSNSEGGLVIWGAPIGKTSNDTNRKIFNGALSPCDRLIEKDSFINRVTDLITPSPRGIQFQRIEKNHQYIYIIETEKSQYAPHQFRNIYYMRIDGQTKPAPHHYIEALFRKITFPKLEGRVIINSIRPNGSQFMLQLTFFIFNNSKLQNEHEIYYRLIITVGKFTHRYGNGKSYTNNESELRNENAKSTLYYNEPIVETETILFSPADLTQSNFECDILLFFAGKQSPLMVSRYKLSIKDINTSNPNPLITNSEENLYSYENSDRIQKTEEEKMKILLGGS